MDKNSGRVWTGSPGRARSTPATQEALRELSRARGAGRQQRARRRSHSAVEGGGHRVATASDERGRRGAAPRHRGRAGQGSECPETFFGGTTQRTPRYRARRQREKKKELLVEARRAAGDDLDAASARCEDQRRWDVAGKCPAKRSSRSRPGIKKGSGPSARSREQGNAATEKSERAETCRSARGASRFRSDLEKAPRRGRQRKIKEVEDNMHHASMSWRWPARPFGLQMTRG